MPASNTAISCGIAQLFFENSEASSPEEILKRFSKSFLGIPGGNGLTSECAACGSRNVKELSRYPSIGPNKGLILFSNVVEFAFNNLPAPANWCSRLAAYIEEHNLGDVVKTRNFKNPNTGNIIAMWMWYVDKAKFQDWVNKNKSLQNKAKALFGHK